MPVVMNKFFQRLHRLFKRSNRKQIQFQQYHAGSPDNSDFVKKQILSKLLGQDCGGRTK